MASLPMIGAFMNLSDLNKSFASAESTDKMPVLFVGHGSPTNALESNEFTKGWHNSVSGIDKPKAILCISAHWETKGTMITCNPKPRTIHDFGGFARELYEIYYPADGNPDLAKEIAQKNAESKINLDLNWGLDHGCWVPIMKMYPDADIPTLQLSLDYTLSTSQHYSLGKSLAYLRSKGILIVASGNMVHNLGMIDVRDWNDINREHGYDWALEMNEIFKKKILEQDHKSLIEYESLGKAARLAIPTSEHYLPLIYALAMQDLDERVEFFNDKAVAGSLSMTSVIIGKI